MKITQCSELWSIQLPTSYRLWQTCAQASAASCHTEHGKEEYSNMWRQTTINFSLTLPNLCPVWERTDPAQLISGLHTRGHCSVGSGDGAAQIHHELQMNTVVLEPSN